jgi:glutamate synthase (NADPH/NADH) small chain
VTKKISTKEKLQLQRQTMPEQEPLIRNANFGEVNLGLPEKVALIEAQRCLLCKDPKCVSGCPVMVNIPRFIDFLSQGNIEGAAQSLLDDNALPAVTGRVCPQETQCEVECIRGHKGLPVAIGYWNGTSVTGMWSNGAGESFSGRLQQGELWPW